MWSKNAQDFSKKPLINKNDIEYRHNLVESFLYNYKNLEIITKLLANIPDLERAIARVTAKTNNPRDLILIRQFIDFTEKIFIELKEVEEKIYANLFLKKSSRPRIQYKKDYRRTN